MAGFIDLIHTAATRPFTLLPDDRRGEGRTAAYDPHRTTLSGMRFFLYGWWLSIMALVVLQNYATARYHGTSFYWSECLLFNSYWLLFLPATLLLLRFSGRFSQWRSRPVYYWGSTLVVVAFFSLLHLLVFAVWIDLASVIVLDVHFPFSKVWPKFMVRDLYQGIVVYGLMMIMFSYRNAYHPQSPPPVDRPAPTEPAPLLVEIGNKKVRLASTEIDWLAKDGAYVRIHCGSKKYLRRTTLQRLAEELSGGPFVRIHRSFIVNLERVRTFRSRQNGDYDLILSDGTTLRLSRRYRDEVLARLCNAGEATDSPDRHTA